MTGSEEPRRPEGREADTSPEVAAAREQVEHTREELAETVAALAEKVDVKSRAKDKVTEVRERARHAVGQAGQTAQSTAARLKDRTVNRTSDVATRARGVSPAEARMAATRAANTVTSRPGVLAGVGAALAAVGLALWRRGR
jgi:hypothetical protein